MSRDDGSSDFHFSVCGLEAVKWKVGEMVEGTRSYECQVLEIQM